MPDCPARLFRLFIVYQELTESFSSAASRRDEPAGGRDSCTTSSLSQIFQCSIFKTGPCRVAAASPFRKSPAKLRRKSEPAKFLTNFFSRNPNFRTAAGVYTSRASAPRPFRKAGAKLRIPALTSKFFEHFFQPISATIKHKTHQTAT